MKKLFTLLTMATLVVLFSGCTGTNRAGNVNKQNVGTVLGAVVGGIAGKQVGSGKANTAAIILGTLGGAYLGSQIGARMDKADEMEANAALEHRPDGYTKSWQNPNTGAKYAVTPTKTWTNPNGSPCREFTTDAWIDGKKESVVGKACRDSKGRWVSQS